MEQNTKHLTQLWLSKLPKSYKFIGIDELKRALLPLPLVHRIRQEVIHELRESLKAPVSEWVDHTSKDFVGAWADFVTRCETQIRIPKAQMDRVMQICVSDLVESLVRPRTAIPAQLFRDKNKATQGTLQKARERIVANRHLPFAVLRYMEKNELEELSKKECLAIVAEVDRRISEKYILSEWESALEPIFGLFGGELDADVIRLFFEDKEMGDASLVFSELDKPLHAKDIRPLLRPVFFPELKNVMAATYSNLTTERAPNSASDENVEEVQGSLTEDGSIGGSLVEGGSVELGSIDRAPVELGSEGRSSDELGSEGRDSSEHVDESEEYFVKSEGEEFEPASDSSDDFEPVRLEPIKEPEPEVVFDFDAPVNYVPETYLNDENEQEPTLADRFKLDDEEESVADLFREESYSEDEEQDRENTFGKSTLNSSKAGVPSLEEWLVLDRQRFIDMIFGGSDSAYDLALEELEVILDWKLASRYIEKEVFGRNMIDMFEEAAIDFTDRLQSYFIEYK